MKKLIEKYKYLLETEFAKNSIVRLFFFLELFLVGVSTLALILLWKPVNQPVPLSYTSFVQAVETGPWYLIYQFPLFGLLVLITNGLLAKAAFSKDKLISYLLMGFGAFVNLLFLIDVINFIGLAH